MTINQIPLNGSKTEASFVVELKRKPVPELLSFISFPWTASILSPVEIEEIYQSLKQQGVTWLDETEVSFIEIGMD